MRSFPLQIVTADGMVFDGQAESISVRAAGGDMSVQAGHCDYVTVLGMGQARLIVDGKVRTAACIGGMLAVADGKVRLVPTTFEWAEDIDLTRARHAKEYAEAYLNSHPGETDSREYRHFEAKHRRSLIRIGVAQGASGVHSL